MKIFRLWFVSFVLLDGLVTAIYFEFIENPRAHNLFLSTAVFTTSLLGLWGVFKSRPFFLLPSIAVDWVGAGIFISEHVGDAKMIVLRLGWSVLNTAMTLLLCRDFYRNKL